MKKLEKPLIARINDNIKHQNIGGKIIVIEREGTLSYALDMPLAEMTIGLANFVNRYKDINLPDNEIEDRKLYYGHVGTLGYFVAEDEITDLREVEWSDAYQYLQY